MCASVGCGADEACRSAFILPSQVFERMDRDGSGLVSKEELRSALPPWATDEDVKREFQRIDGDDCALPAPCDFAHLWHASFGVPVRDFFCAANGDGEVTLDEIRMAWGQTDASAWLRVIPASAILCAIHVNISTVVGASCRIYPEIFCRPEDSGSTVSFLTRRRYR